MDINKIIWFRKNIKIITGFNFVLINYKEREQKQKEFDEKIINRPFQEKIIRDREMEEKKMMLNKLMQNDNKDKLKQQIHYRKQQELEKWKKELQYEKDIINAQISNLFLII